MISAVVCAQNNNGGNGKGYSPLRSPIKYEPKSINVLNQKDAQMRFRNSRDPIYVAFDYVEKQSLKNLAKGFVNEIFGGTAQFLSKKN